MRFKPMSEEEITQMFLLPKGDYKVKVVNYTIKTFEGEEFISLDLLALVNGEQKKLQDALWLNGGGMYKTRHFYKAIGEIATYEQGEYPILIPSRPFYAIARVGQKPDKNGIVRNIVSDYFDVNTPVSAPKASELVPEQKLPEFNDDDVPF